MVLDLFGVRTRINSLTSAMMNLSVRKTLEMATIMQQRRRGFSLLELIMVISLIAMLSALLLPALQAAREAARRNECNNHLRQIGLASLTMLESKQAFPYGGWGYGWAPVPGREKDGQPGSWVFNLLPYLEQNVPSTQSRSTNAEANGTEMSSVSNGDELPLHLQILTRPLAVMNCPSRRAAMNYPIAVDRTVLTYPYGHLKEGAVARGDYAINSGPHPVWFTKGPKTLEIGDTESHATSGLRYTGISHYRRGASSKQLIDGTAQTYLIGEKYIYVDEYVNGHSKGDDASLYTGYCLDNHRFTRIDMVPRPDNYPFTKDEGIKRFGGPHVEGCYFVFCDGHVDLIDYGIDGLVHCRNGHRADRELTNCE